MYNFHTLGIDTNGRTGGHVKTYCPQCREQRKNKRDKSLSVNLDTGQYKCHYCDFHGCAAQPGAPSKEPARQQKIPSAGEAAASALLTEEHLRWLTEVRHIGAGAIKQLGIGSSTQYMPQTQKKESCLCFHYYEEGEIRNTKYRDLQKNFKFIGGAELIPYHFDNLCTFELGRLCVITGHPGDGKSEFTDELALRLCLRHQWRVAYFSPENLPLPYHLSKLFEKLTGRRFKQGFLPELLYRTTERFLTDNVSSILPKENFSVETILSRARELVSRRGIRILVLDPFNRLEHQIPVGQTETQYISAFLDQLSGFAVRNRCLVMLVAHPRKMPCDPATGRMPVPTLQDINGSAAFVNKCDFGLVVERDRQAEVTRIHVKKVKFRHLGNLGECTFVYNLMNGRYSPCQCETAEAGHRESFRIVKTDFDSAPWLGNEEVRQGEMF